MNKSSNKKSTQNANLKTLEMQLLKQYAKSPNAQGSRRKKNTSRLPKTQSKGSFNNPSSAASAYSTGLGVNKPKISMGNNSCNVKHREFIGNVQGTANFTQSFALALNPGIAATFPWLANMAQNWQAYRFKKLRFCYYTRTGSNVPGSVILCPDYNAQDGPPVSEQVIDSYEDAREDAPWKNIECILNPISMHLMGPKKFIRLGPLAANQDLKTFDVGNMYLFSVDGTSVNWGKVWVEYEVELFTPQLPSGGSSFTQTATIIGQTGTTPALPLGTAPVIAGNMQITAGSNGTNSIITINNAVVGAEYGISNISVGTSISSPVQVQTYTGATIGNGGSGFPSAATTSFEVRTFTANASTVVLVLFGTASTITTIEIMLQLIPTSRF